MTRRMTAALAGAVAWLGCAAQAQAEGDGWVASFVLENDMFQNGNDRNYSAGQLISVTSPRSARNGRLHRLSRLITPIEDSQREARIELSLSHSMFTPRDLTLAAPDPSDRPYAGLALLSASLIAADDHGRTDNVSYSLGVVGPSARAGELQNWWHDQIGGVHAAGWDSQIQDRAVGGLGYQQTRRRIRLGGENEDWSAELYTHWGFTLGTVQTNASVGASVRIGESMPREYGLPRLSPGLHGSGYFEPTREYGWYAFAGVEQRYVAYDVTLDEAPASGVVTVARRDWVADAQLGVVGYWGPLRLGYSHVWRSEQFRSQAEGDGFGAVSISMTTPLGATTP